MIDGGIVAVFGRRRINRAGMTAKRNHPISSAMLVATSICAVAERETFNALDDRADLPQIIQNRKKGR
jgi:hypothetical protein